MTNIGPHYRPPHPPAQSAHAAPGGKSAIPDGNEAPAGTAQTPQESLPQLGAALLAPLLAHQNALSGEQLVLLLKNLLKMPREIEAFLALFTEQDPQLGAALLQQLLGENPPVSLEALQAFLQTHMDQAQGQLLKLLQTSQMSATASGKEMGGLLQGLETLAAQVEHSPSQALHTAISLYLPYYPLHPPQAFTFRFEPPADGQGEPDSGASASPPQVTALIQTLTLGQFKATLWVEAAGPLQILVEHDPVAAPYTENIRQGVTGSWGPPPQPEPEWHWRARKAAAKAPEVSQAVAGPPIRPSVGIHPAGGVCMRTLQVLYLLIKAILQLDGRLGLNP